MCQCIYIYIYVVPPQKKATTTCLQNSLVFPGNLAFFGGLKKTSKKGSSKGNYSGRFKLWQTRLSEGKVAGNRKHRKKERKRNTILFEGKVAGRHPPTGVCVFFPGVFRFFSVVFFPPGFPACHLAKPHLPSRLLQVSSSICLTSFLFYYIISFTGLKSNHQGLGI